MKMVSKLDDSKGSGGGSATIKMMRRGFLLVYLLILRGAMVMINHLEIDNQSMDHMMEDKAEQQQLTMTLSLLGSSDLAKNQKQQEMNATPNKKKNLCQRSDIRHGKWVGKINGTTSSTTETTVMPMHAPNLVSADISQNYDTCNAPDLYQWQIALKKKTKMTALANSNKNSI